MDERKARKEKQELPQHLKDKIARICGKGEPKPISPREEEAQEGESKE